MYPYEHKYWGAYAGITKKSYGLGTAYYVGCYTSQDILKKVFRDALQQAGIPVLECQWPVILRSGVTPKGGKLHYVLHYTEEQEEFCCPYERVRNLFDGQEYRRGDHILLEDWDVLILQEIKS
jgi:beta-galactosidase